MKPDFVILDRDGVINQDSDDYIKSVAEWIEIPGSLEAIVKLNQANIPVCVATNQSGIGRGYYTTETLHQMHAKFAELLKEKGGHIHRIEYCPHLPSDACSCRKPRTGMLDKIMQENSWLQARGVFVGDSISDFEAARTCGLGFRLVLTGKGEHTRNLLPNDFPANHIYPDLAACVSAMLSTGN